MLPRNISALEKKHKPQSTPLTILLLIRFREFYANKLKIYVKKP